MEKREIANTDSAAEMLENVLVNGDLSKLTPKERLDYYSLVCQKTGLNPVTRPFDYIVLKGKMVLYAKKDATDQLRKIHGVSIDDIDIQETAAGFRVKVKGHDREGRSDVEIGCVSKSDMSGNIQNVEMKAVTKAKRRLTLSICGLGMIDETELDTIPDAKPVVVDSATGEILQEKDQVKKPVFDENDFLLHWSKPSYVEGMSKINAEKMMDSTGKPYGEKTTYELFCMLRTINKKIDTLTEEEKPQYKLKVSAICEILQNRKLMIETEINAMMTDEIQGTYAND